jgi:hypothetical protein
VDRTQGLSNDGQSIASTPVERLSLHKAEDCKRVELTNWILHQAGQRAVSGGDRQAGVQAAVCDDGRRAQAVLHVAGRLVG